MVMEIKATIDKNELDNDYLEDYFVFSPGEYKNQWQNDNSFFLSAFSLEFIEDLLIKANENYIIDNFEYFNHDQLNVLEDELSKRSIEIVQNKEVSSNYEYLNKNIRRYKKEIIEMLNKTVKWIESNKENGLTLYRIREYKLITDKNEPYGGYYEFLPGKFHGEYRSGNSVFVSETSVDFIIDLLDKSNKEFDPYGVVYYDNNQLNIFEHELSKRLIDIRENKGITGRHFKKIYLDSLNKEIKIYQNDIIKMFEEFIMWIKLNRGKGITVLGP
jgi:hypothetical protein